MKIKYFALSLLMLPFMSCSDDLLYQDPSTSLSDDNIFESADNVNGVLNGAYSWTGHYYYLTIGQISQDVMGNDLKITDGTYGFSTYNWLMFAYAYQQYPRVVDGWWSAYSPYIWQTAYKAIDQCNQIIANEDKLPEGTEDMLAQAYGLRGWNFLNLYHLFCTSYTNTGDEGQGLFLRLTPGDSSGENVGRSNLKVSLQRIIDDFTYASENCEDKNGNYFMNKKAASLLLARTYLDMGNYDKALEALAKVGSSYDGTDLMSQEEYQSGFNTLNDEWLWGFNFTSETSNIYASIPSFYYIAKAKDADSGFGTPGYGTKVESTDYLAKNAVEYLVGYGTVRANNSFVAMFKDGDYRKLFPFYVNEKDGYAVAKFSSKGSLGIADYPFCRMAEAYLIAAECYLMSSTQNDPDKAKDILNTLQQKRNGEITGTVTIDEIWNERRRELYGEGFALADLKRLQKPLERTGVDHWCDVLSLPANSPRMMFPIPADELDYNKQADESDQNEYWRN